ncbi:MAG: hypothetical protein M3Y75_03395 [Actinomycetota bacterium]|nr:hypothetical protein [Actinomycetota bacterium]
MPSRIVSLGRRQFFDFDPLASAAPVDVAVSSEGQGGGKQEPGGSHPELGGTNGH